MRVGASAPIGTSGETPRTNARIEKARARRNKKPTREIFARTFYTCIGRVVGPEAPGTLPNPLAEIIEIIVRGYRLDSEQFRSAPRTCRPLCGTLSLRQTGRFGLSVLVTPGREQGPCST